MHGRENRRKRLGGWAAALAVAVAGMIVIPQRGLAQEHREGHHEGHCEEHGGPAASRAREQLIRAVKQGEAEARAEIERLEREAKGDAELVQGLRRVGKEHRLAGESTRQAFLRAVDRIQGDEERAEALRMLLAAAPITEETGRAVIASARRASSDHALYRVLSYLHEIQESDLVRGPLARDYLDAAERLRGGEHLANALAELLHPSPVEEGAVRRALEMAQRVDSDDGRRRVLREVTDHQAITPEVEAAYLRVAERIAAAEVKRETEERLRDAREGGGRERRSLAPADREALRNEARRLKEEARELRRHLKERAKELKRRLKEEWKDGDEELDLDVEG
jgi:hypothetical protein